MPWNETILYGNDLAAWLSALTTGALVLTLLVLLRYWAVVRLARLATVTRTTLDDLFTATLRRTTLPFLIVVALYAGIATLESSPGVSLVTSRVLVIALLLQCAIWADSFATELAQRLAEERDGPNMAMISVLGFLSRLVIWALAILLVLDNMGVDVTALIAGLGIGGVAVALAAQNILGDLLASFSIVLDKPFVVGDFIVVDDLLGTVDHIGIKTTRVRSLSGEQLVFPNSDLLHSRIRNFKQMYERRVVFELRIDYRTPRELIERVPQLLREAVERHEKTRFDRAHFAKYGEYALLFETVYYVLDPDYNLYMDIQQGINLQIHRRFGELGIAFAFPTRAVFMEPATGS